MIMVEPKTSKYIYDVSPDPLKVVLLRQSTLELLKKYPVEGIYFDATGKVTKHPVCHPYHSYKRILYYACVVNINNHLVPIGELISSKHDYFTIKHFLDDLIQNMPKNFKPKFFVTDWSWPLIKSILISFNQMTITEYIDYTYDVIMSNKKIQINKVGSFIIYCAHFVNIISSQLTDKWPSSVTKNFILDLFCGILNCDSLQDVDDLFKLYCVICCSQFENQIVLKSLKSVHKILGRIYQNENHKNEITPSETETWRLPQRDTFFKKSTFSCSPYYIRYNRIFMETSESNNNESNNFTFNSKVNDFYNAEFVSFTLKQYMPFLPLWGVCFARKLGIEGRLSNANAESWFSIVKNHYTNHQSLRLGRFISILKEKTEKMTKLIQLKEIKNPRAFRKITKRLKTLDLDNEPNEETWNKKIKIINSPKHFGKRVLSRFVLCNHRFIVFRRFS